MVLFERLVCLAIGYLTGCFQTAYIVGKIFKNIDIRKHGSGNAGMTNTTRVLGAKFGMLVFFADVLKAILAFTLCSIMFNGSGSFFSGENGVIPGVYAGLGVVLGHNFPVFLKFRGGKGIAASIGLILCFDIKIALIVYLCGAISVFITRYISVASLVILGLLPVMSVIFKYPPEIVVLCFILCAVAYYMHRGNIKRLLTRTERKFNLLSKGEL